jgi:hypothetical protein
LTRNGLSVRFSNKRLSVALRHSFSLGWSMALTKADYERGSHTRFILESAISPVEQ